jgi:hypothetical protein
MQVELLSKSQEVKLEFLFKNEKFGKFYYTVLFHANGEVDVNFDFQDRLKAVNITEKEFDDFQEAFDKFMEKNEYFQTAG